MTLVGADGCPDGWLCVVERGDGLEAFVAADIGEVITRIGLTAIVAIDIPIGLPDQGPRACDQLARKLLGQPRGSSVFPAPVRSTLTARDHREASDLHELSDCRRLSAQAYGILGKIREVAFALDARPELQWVLHEVHPEVSFTFWNEAKPMSHGKKTPEGRTEREQLIDARWPGARSSLRQSLRSHSYSRDDLNDAFAALWSARRIQQGVAVKFPNQETLDVRGTPMVIRA